MKRTEFSGMVWRVLKHAEDCGYKVIIDQTKRSLARQQELFKAGLTDCDGIIKKSKHQSGEAIDIYIIENGKISNDKIKYMALHKKWESLGGRKMIRLANGTWDMGHFE